MPHNKRTQVVLVAGLLALGCLAAMQKPLRQWVGIEVTLANAAPRADQVAAVIQDSADREGSIVAAWNTGKIIQREVAAREIADPNVIKGKLPAKLEAIAMGGCLDADLNVREACLAALDTRNDPALAALASAQLKDCDPQIRLLGLQYLRNVDAKIGIPAVIPILDDDDPEVAVSGLKLLERWTGQNFGVKVWDVLPSQDPELETPNIPADGLAKLRSAVGSAKQWWAHQAQPAPANLAVPSEVLANIGTVPAGDFALTDLTGRKARLTDYRGKIVVINFWTTWCTACVAEIPELIQLENQYQGGVVVLGVSLDSLPDDDGDQANTNSIEDIRIKVARVVQSKNINYPVFLDVHNDAGGQYNGGELPTTIIVDAGGNIRRRFIGSRQLRTFASMIAEAGKPLASIQRQAVALK